MGSGGRDKHLDVMGCSEPSGAPAGPQGWHFRVWEQEAGGRVTVTLLWAAGPPPAPGVSRRPTSAELAPGSAEVFLARPQQPSGTPGPIPSADQHLGTQHGAGVHSWAGVRGLGRPPPPHMGAQPRARREGCRPLPPACDGSESLPRVPRVPWPGSRLAGTLLALQCGVCPGHGAQLC